MDFANGETAIILQKKLLPVLEELARAEFGVYSFFGSVDTETSAWMQESKEILDHKISAYLQGLLELHMKYGQRVK